MAGGTGGHVFPALAVARRLLSGGWDVHWLGTQEGMEAEIVPKAGIPLHFISIKGLRRKGRLAWVLAPFQILGALYQSFRIISQLKPNVVLGMGGFVSGPGGIASWLKGCPLVIHEQNAIVGLTNRFLARFATVVLQAFPNAFHTKANAIYTGNPVRDELLVLPTPNERFKDRQGPLRLLILGGSRGAIALNEVCPKAIAQIPLEVRPKIWHQAGGGQQEATAKLYQASGVEAQVAPFIEDMAVAYAWADLVLCRAGALTITELATVGVGSILVPFPFAVDDHQTYNGRFLEKINAAKLIAQSVLKPEYLADIILDLTNDRHLLLKMAEAAYHEAKRDALNEVVNHCEETGNRAFKK